MVDNYNMTLSYGATNDVLDPLQAFTTGKFGNNNNKNNNDIDAPVIMLENNKEKDFRNMHKNWILNNYDTTWNIHVVHKSPGSKKKVRQNIDI